MTQGPFLILLVGSNPLPNYLAACALRPSRVVLVHTEETRDAKDRLRRELTQVLGTDVTIEDSFVEDATCATTVRRSLDLLMSHNGGGDVLLNYTGGTKVMSAHARLAFYDAEGKPEHASYLDEGGRDKSGKDHQPRLRFDDGNSKALAGYSEIPLALPPILALHGITHRPREAKRPAPTEDDAKAILCGVLHDTHLAERLYQERQRLTRLRRPREAIDDPFKPSDFELTLSLGQVPDSAEMSRGAYEQWYRFIGGEWLEEWLGAQIRALELAPAPDITVGVNAYLGEQEAQLEVDVAVVRGHRSYFVSCTTDTSKPICKSKLFELAVRSRQVGGDLSRAALVCLADDPVVSALQTDVNDVWCASNTTRVFGLSDIRAWSDCNERRPNQRSLKAWLES